MSAIRCPLSEIERFQDELEQYTIPLLPRLLPIRYPSAYKHHELGNSDPQSDKPIELVAEFPHRQWQTDFFLSVMLVRFWLICYPPPHKSS